MARPVSALHFPTKPDPFNTPGAVDPAATLSVLCDRPPRPQPDVKPWVKEYVLSTYNIPLDRSAEYDINQLIPPALGGANAIYNLWPQPHTEVDKKLACESAMQHRICTAYRTLPADDAADLLAQAQHDIADDWPNACSPYIDR